MVEEAVPRRTSGGAPSCQRYGPPLDATPPHYNQTNVVHLQCRLNVLNNRRLIRRIVKQFVKKQVVATKCMVRYEFISI